MKDLTDLDIDRITFLLRNRKALPDQYKEILFETKREYELRYAEKKREEDILSETMAVPLQTVKTFGSGPDREGWANMLIFGDNLQISKTLLQMKEKGALCSSDGSAGARLIYIDPPFGTGEEYGVSTGAAAYSARVMGSKYIEFLRERLVFLRQLLSDDGSIYVRIDYHFGHYIKAIMDEIFGIENFRNEIVINRFKRQLRGLNQFNVATDSIFLYTKSDDAVFNEITRKRICSFCGQEKPPEWHHMVSSGLRNPPERLIFGQLKFPPRGQHWKYTQEKIDKMTEEGRLRMNEDVSYTDIRGNREKGVPEFLQTEDTPVDSNWTDLKGYQLSSRYPTENPEELLHRVIAASSKEGDLVLDSFAGSGTTLAVAEKLGRRWIGIDCGKLATYTMQKRLLNISKSRELENGKRIYGKPYKPFALSNAGLYDYRMIKELPWAWKGMKRSTMCFESPTPSSRNFTAVDSPKSGNP